MKIDAAGHNLYKRVSQCAWLSHRSECVTEHKIHMHNEVTVQGAITRASDSTYFVDISRVSLLTYLLSY